MFALSEACRSAEDMRALGSHVGLDGKRLVVQGLGNVGYHTAKFCREQGAIIVALAERVKAVWLGDHVCWNSEAGQVSGRIIRVHTRDVAYKGYTHHASPDAPQYEIKSDRTDHIAMHKGTALTKIED